MRLVKATRRTRINNLRPGAIFMFRDGVLAVKSEYRTIMPGGDSEPDCYLLASGERLWSSGVALVHEMLIEDDE